MSSHPSISPSSSAARIPTTSTTSSPPRNPSHLSIPASNSSADQSPTTPTNATATPVQPRSLASLDQYRLAPSQAASTDAGLSHDEQALQNLTADAVHNPNKASSSTIGNVSEQSAMDQVLSGILTMQKEVSNKVDLHWRTRQTSQ